MRADILQQAQAIRASMDAAAIVLTDEQAAKAPRLYPAWKTSKSYTVGERLRYNGILYKVLQAHTSQEDWTPDVAVSLFAKVLISDPSTIPAWEPGVYGWEKAV